MPQNNRPPACPGCAEPPEAGDLFCGACGTDLRPAMPAHPPLPATPPPAPLVPGAGPGEGHGTPAGGSEGSLQAAAPGPGAAGTPAPGGERPPATEPGAQAPQPADSAASPDSDRQAEPAPVPEEEGGGSAGGSRSGRTPPAPDAGAASEPGPRRAEETRCVACGTGAVGADGHCTHCGHQQPLARDHWERRLGGIGAASDRGLRHRRNEDFFTVADAEAPDGGRAGIAVVCDGVSSAQRSDQASEAAAEAAGASLREAITRGVHAQEAMHDALVAAAGAVDALATEEEREAQRNAPACTIVGTVVAAGILTVGWIGDSRAYWVPDDRDAQPARLTEDDSWAAQMVAAGLLSEQQAYADARAHAITGWLGADAYELDPHTASFQPDRPGVVIVCTDGLWNYAETAEQMAAAVPADAADRPLAAARHLVGFALDGGGHDNVTVAVVPCATPTETEPAG